MSCRWKRNWPETQANFRAWWHGRGLVLNLGDFPVTPPALAVADPGEAASPVQKHADAAWIAARCRAQRANRDYEHGDILPVAFVDWGTVSLAAYLGAEVELTPDTVWYHPRPGDPLAWGPLRFDPAARWFRIHRTSTGRACRPPPATSWSGSRASARTSRCWRRCAAPRRSWPT